jgi:Tropinone reductase 1
MAKAGLESFTRTLAVELGGDGVRANAILPGFTATETFMSKYDDRYLQRALRQIPLNRMANPTDIANLACFLAMPASSYITGQCINVDGGFTIYGFGGVIESE